MTRREIALVGGLVLAGIVGAFLANRQLDGLHEERALARHASSEEVARLRADNAQLRQDEKAQEPAPVSLPMAMPVSPPPELAAASRADRMSALLAWAKIMTRGGGGASLRMQQRSMDSQARARAMGANLPAISGPAFVVGTSHELQPRFGELFALRDDQVAQLQQALDVATAGFDELVAAHTQIRDNGNGSYILEVKEVPESVIAPDRDRMIAAFRQMLGEDGYQAFALLNGESQESSAANQGGPSQFFNSYGIVGRTATITISKTASDYRYEMQHPNGRGSGSAPSLEELRPMIGGGIKLLPPGF